MLHWLASCEKINLILGRNWLIEWIITELRLMIVIVFSDITNCWVMTNDYYCCVVGYGCNID